MAHRNDLATGSYIQRMKYKLQSRGSARDSDRMFSAHKGSKFILESANFRSLRQPARKEARAARRHLRFAKRRTVNGIRGSPFMGSLSLFSPLAGAAPKPLNQGPRSVKPSIRRCDPMNTDAAGHKNSLVDNIHHSFVVRRVNAAKANNARRNTNHDRKIGNVLRHN